MLTHPRLRSFQNHAFKKVIPAAARRGSAHALQRAAAAVTGAAGVSDWTTTTLTPPQPIDSGPLQSFATTPLFPAQPSVHDVHLGVTPDCYFDVALQMVIYVWPQLLPYMIKAVDGGKFRIYFYDLSTNQRFSVLVDDQLPTNENAVLGSKYVALSEKGYVGSGRRGNNNSYAALAFGFIAAALRDLGFYSISYTPTFANTPELMIEALESGSKAVGISTAPTMYGPHPLITQHAYLVMGYRRDAAGKIWWICQNPWGVDGAGTDANPDDGTVEVSSDALSDGSINGVVICLGPAFEVPAAPVEVPATPPVLGPAVPLSTPPVPSVAFYKPENPQFDISWQQELPYEVFLERADTADFVGAGGVTQLGSSVTRKAEVAGIQWVAHNVVRMDRLPQEAFYRTRTATGVSAAVRAPGWTPPAIDVVEPSKPTAADEQVARFQAALALASTELAMSRWMADVQQAVFGRVK
ncbi:MAG TPA: C2 family cysteine protease [Phycisphaerae bacterium]|nr:C2 family cysteine protease [Phycisphaerae bacterium]